MIVYTTNARAQRSKFALGLCLDHAIFFFLSDAAWYLAARLLLLNVARRLQEFQTFRPVENWKPTLGPQAQTGNGGPVRRVLRAVVREPLFHFIATGAALWLATSYVESRSQRFVIHIGTETRHRLAMAYQQQFAQPPSRQQLQQLLGHYVTEEIFLREGLALNLEKDDEIVRRRIAQKYEFLQTDLAAPQEPTASVLQGWFETNQSRYMTPPLVTFTQVYFSEDRDGDDAAETRAARALPQLIHGGAQRAANIGDTFPGPTDSIECAPDAAERLFGKSDLSAMLFTAPLGQWVGPVRSGYGWHLIYISERKPPQLPGFDDIRSRVLGDYMIMQRQRLNAQAAEKLRAKYKIVQDDAP